MVELVSPKARANTAAHQGDEHYANHLAGVNETREVTSTGDIYNDRGVLVMKAGARLDKSVYEKIKKHQLAQSLASQVSVSDTLNRDTLAEEFRRLLGTYLDLQLISENLHLRTELDAIVRSYAINPVTAQKLTVFKHQYPQSFDGVLFGAWLAAMIARVGGCGRGDVTDTFVASLCRDLGLLHIDPVIVHKKQELTPAEWRALQSHTIVGKMILQSTSSASPQVLRAIVEHHERGHGLGYPAGLFGEGISMLGRMVGLADTIQAVRIGRFEREKRNLADMLPTLTINAQNFGDDVYRAVIELLRSGGVTPTLNECAQRGDGATLKSVDASWQRLTKVGSFLEMLTAVLGMLDESDASKRVKAITQQIEMVVTRSGLLTIEMGQWLAQCGGKKLSKEDCRVICEMELMIGELRWQLRDARKAYDQLFSRMTENAGPEIKALQKMADELSHALED